MDYANMLRNIFRVTTLAFLALPPGPSHGQSTATSIAATLQNWRDLCSDPSPDLAFGHLIDAMATSSVDIRKACLRQILLSDNADLQNAAMRVVMTTVPAVRFRMTSEVKDGESSYMEFVQKIRTGLIFHVSEGDQQAGSATWRPAIDAPKPGEKDTGRMTVFGSDIHWAGTLANNGQSWPCRLSASLTEGTRLVGAFGCRARSLIPVEANIFD